MDPASAHFVRVVRRSGADVSITFDGRPVAAVEGDSVLAALLLAGPFLRRLEFGGEPRAGFCLIGACQDCWVWSRDGGRVRACTTLVADGMALFAEPPPMGAARG